MIRSFCCLITCVSIVAAGSTTTAPAAAAPKTAPSAAAPTEAEKKLALESEKYCKSTAATSATPAMIVEKVKKACALIDKEGTKAFTKFQGDKSPFIFGGTYLVINGFDGIMLMHPINPAMNGKNYMDLKDKNGKLFFAEMITTCKEKGEGWIDFYWPKPGEKEPSPKVSYVHKATCDGKEVVVSCGVYDLTLQEVKKALAK